MDQAEASGRTVDDALSRALAKLGATRKDVDEERVEFRVLDEGRKGGLFGRGARDATVAAWWAGREGAREGAGEAAPAPAARAERSQRPARQQESGASAPPAGGEEAKHRRRGGRGRGGRGGTGTGGDARSGGGARQGYEAASPKLTDADFLRPRFDEQPRDERPERPERADRPARPARSEGSRGSRAGSDSRASAPPQRRDRRRHEEEPRVEPNIDAPEVDFAAQTVDDLLRIFGIEAEISIREPLTAGDGLGSAFAVIDIKGDDLGVLIGRRGDTLIAMQYLVNLILSRHYPGQGGVTIDVEHYRHRNEERILALARRMADRVRESGSPITLEPMSPAERRLVHLEFMDDADIETNSVGEGEHRKVVISRR
ncbi:MAG: Jag N-terminal domain-containing protein [Dehalococcoidia bacterium]|nr:Jag N-terminal domain-containing protein [Dehalococcoidia bacterium]